VRAYIHTGVCVMFATMPYSLDEKYLHNPELHEKKAKAGETSETRGSSRCSTAPTPCETQPGVFEPRVHLSNFDINARPENAHNYLADKPGIGKGSLWSSRRFEAWLSSERPDIGVQKLWRQLRLIARECALGIARHRKVRELNKGAPPGLQHELFGLDVMLDNSGKCWLLECNNSPGLEYCGSHFPDGSDDPDGAENDAVTWSVIEDRFALLGIDRSCEGNATRGKAENYLRVC
jgi:hypothetical protein